MKKIGLALSGGSAKGFAHVGVIQAFREAGIAPAFVSGTSAGAIVAALYAAGHSIGDIADFVLKSNLSRIFRIQYPRFGLMSLSYLHDRLIEYIPHNSFEGLRMPLCVCTTNLNSGLTQFFRQGELARPVVASASIPGLFRTVKIGDSVFADGGVTCNLPARALRKDCDILVGVNLMPPVPRRIEEVRTLKAITLRCFALSIASNSQPDIEACDYLIESHKIAQFGMFELKRAQEIIEVGYEAALPIVAELRAILDKEEL